MQMLADDERLERQTTKVRTRTGKTTFLALTYEETSNTTNTKAREDTLLFYVGLSEHKEGSKETRRQSEIKRM